MRNNGYGVGACCIGLAAWLMVGGRGASAGVIPTVMTPNLLEGAVGNSDWYMGWQSEYSVQVFVAASELAALPAGSGITGMSFRCSPRSLSFPGASVNIPRFDVTLSPSVFSPMNIDPTFANNIGPGAVQVRAGAMLVPAGAFPTSGDPAIPAENAWYVPFTGIYVYEGGDLCVTIRTKGQLTGSGLFDGYAFGPTAVGSALYNYGNANAESGSKYGPLGIRFAFAEPTNCVGDLNFDQQVDDADFTIFVVAYNILDCADPAMPAGCSSDLNDDGVVNDDDFVIFIAAYNELICP